ncbi:uncharacterized protein LOC105253047 isoform X2 [Camponotus floridanus]|uniref:uncharacterized protein LOC105253047 isoform X2 n=1 Tax=Camponotus floridanus TaxID=104421 RepID=UPI00059B9619|nr:uncharacterized protein LOC105253047 isoform X2 [Camponotus floridanus]
MNHSSDTNHVLLSTVMDVVDVHFVRERIRTIYPLKRGDRSQNFAKPIFIKEYATTSSNQRNTMSTKTNTNTERITATNKKTGKKLLKAHDVEHKHVTAGSAKEVVFLSKGDIVEVTLKRQEKAKDQKHTSPVISSPGQKAERKRSATSNSEAPRSWGAILGEQNLLYMKAAQSYKHSENKEINKNSNAKKVQQNGYNHVEKHTDTKSKGMPSQEKSKKDSKDLYVLVQDRAVQCPEIGNNANRFVEFNPVHTLSFLMKELKDLITKKDDRTCEIFAEMEQVLLRIPVGSAKPIEDLEKLDTLEAGAIHLKESSKKVKALLESWASEREKLQSLIRERDAQIKEANQKQKEIVLHAEMLKLEEVTCVTKAKDEVISALKEQIINNEKLISDLEAELSKQTEFARRYECLKIDKDKLLKLSSCKDTLITQYQNTIMELQTQLENLKLNNLDEVFAKGGSTSSQVSAIQIGLAYSSPTSSFSDHSNKSWHDLSDISTVEHASREHVTLKEEVPVRDSARLEFVSLLDGESSHTIIPDQSQVMNDKGTVHNNNKSNIIPYQNVNDVIPKRCLYDSLKKGHNKENDMCKMRKFSKFKERQKDNTKNSFCHNTSKILESVTSKPVISDIRKQGYDMHNRIPVNVPSPLRDYPYPDWSDSSLPSSCDMQSYNTYSTS